MSVANGNQTVITFHQTSSSKFVKNAQNFQLSLKNHRLLRLNFFRRHSSTQIQTIHVKFEGMWKTVVLFSISLVILYLFLAF